ncbi:MAG: ATP-binding protein [Candidatus Eremiobacterota bacterium]
MRSPPLHVLLIGSDSELAIRIQEALNPWTVSWGHGGGARGETADAAVVVLAFAPPDSVEKLRGSLAVVGLGTPEECLSAIRQGAHEALGLEDLPRLQRAVTFAAERFQRERASHLAPQAQKMEAIGRLSAGLTHDFRNLVSIIRTNCRILRRVAFDARIAGPVDEIELAGKKAWELVEQLLLFAREGQTSEPTRMDLNQVVRNMEPLLHPVTGDRVRLRLDLHPDELAVVVNPTHVEQIVMNLVVNAVDVMPEGGQLGLHTGVVRIEPPCPPTPPPGAYAALTVWDTGEGISPQHQVHIFEPFFTTKTKGTGLGLSTAHTLARGLGGELTFTTRRGVGTAFRLLLPAQGMLPVPAVPVVSRPGSVLILESHPLELQHLAQRLAQLGLRVLEARQASEAVRLCRWTHESIDWLLVDLDSVEGQVEPLLSTCYELRPELSVAVLSALPRAMLDTAGWLPPGLPLLEMPLTLSALAGLLSEERVQRVS